MFFVNPNIKDDIHMVRDSGSVRVLCEDAASVWGNMAEMLTTIKVKIVVMIIFPVPFLSSIKLEDSLCRVLMMTDMVHFVELFVLGVLVNITNTAVIDDKYLIFMRDDDGSNMENMFLIISSFLKIALFLEF